MLFPLRKCNIKHIYIDFKILLIYIGKQKNWIIDSQKSRVSIHKRRSCFDQWWWRSRHERSSTRRSSYRNYQLALEAYGIYDGYQGLVEDQHWKAWPFKRIWRQPRRYFLVPKAPEFKDVKVREKGIENLKKHGIEALGCWPVATVLITGAKKPTENEATHVSVFQALSITISQVLTTQSVT